MWGSYLFIHLPLVGRVLDNEIIVPDGRVIMVGAGQAGITFAIHQYLVIRLSRPGCRVNFAIHQNLVSCLFGSGRPRVGGETARG
ncbi:MAG: hypothetical protein GY796_07705 [Chloroflexi bacterium]|nr:hypothetical protein [Chloroflexota bacterium]